jgi:hypothetical protein
MLADAPWATFHRDDHLREKSPEAEDVIEGSRKNPVSAVFVVCALHLSAATSGAGPSDIRRLDHTAGEDKTNGRGHNARLGATAGRATAL